MTENELEQLIRPLVVGDRCVLIKDDITYKKGTYGYITDVFIYNVGFKITGKNGVYIFPKHILKPLP